jgi:CPA2 family monovalent cation:H+ antiporter-2
MALGGFIAGLLLAETEYRRAIEATIEPFKSLLLGVFFFAVGMSLDLSLVALHPGLVAGGLLGLLLIKAILLFLLARLFRLSTAAALESAFLLAPAGEFAFVIFALASTHGVLTAEHSALAVAIASLSMALTPTLGALGRAAGKRFERPAEIAAEALVLPPEDHVSRAIVVGYGRVGRLVTEMLERHHISFIAIDADARAVARWRQSSRSVYWGNATNAAFLERCGLAEASAIIVTIDRAKEIEAVVAAARAVRPDVVIVARARDAEHARALYALGVTDAVPETIEASLQLSEAALSGLGIATGPVIASIHERRDEFRRELQSAAGRETRAVRAPRHKIAGR